MVIWSLNRRRKYLHCWVCWSLSIKWLPRGGPTRRVLLLSGVNFLCGIFGVNFFLSAPLIYVFALLTPVISSRCNYVNTHIYSIDSCDVIKMQLCLYTYFLNWLLWCHQDAIMLIYIFTQLTHVMSSRCNYGNIHISSIDSCDVIKMQLC